MLHFSYAKTGVEQYPGCEYEKSSNEKFTGYYSFLLCQYPDKALKNCMFSALFDSKADD